MSKGKLSKMELDALTTEIVNNLNAINEQKYRELMELHEDFIKSMDNMFSKNAEVLVKEFRASSKEFKQLIQKVLDSNEKHGIQQNHGTMLLKLMLHPNRSRLTILQQSLLPEPKRPSSFSTYGSTGEKIRNALIIAQMDNNSTEDMIRLITNKFIK
jgi:DNA anti-recombination protein RmuC